MKRTITPKPERHTRPPQDRPDEIPLREPYTYKDGRTIITHKYIKGKCADFRVDFALAVIAPSDDEALPNELFRAINAECDMGHIAIEEIFVAPSDSGAFDIETGIYKWKRVKSLLVFPRNALINFKKEILQIAQQCGIKSVFYAKCDGLWRQYCTQNRENYAFGDIVRQVSANIFDTENRFCGRALGQIRWRDLTQEPYYRINSISGEIPPLRTSGLLEYWDKGDYAESSFYDNPDKNPLLDFQYDVDTPTKFLIMAQPLSAYKANGLGLYAYKHSEILGVFAREYSTNKYNILILAKPDYNPQELQVFFDKSRLVQYREYHNLIEAILIAQGFKMIMYVPAFISYDTIETDDISEAKANGDGEACFYNIVESGVTLENWEEKLEALRPYKKFLKQLPLQDIHNHAT